MTHARRTDTAQPAIVADFLAVGASVLDLHAIGIKGAPDVLIGLYGRNWLFEIKTPGLDRESKHRQHFAEQKAWRASWRGQVHQVTSFTEALDIIKAEIEEE